MIVIVTLNIDMQITIAIAIAIAIGRCTGMFGGDGCGVFRYDVMAEVVGEGASASTGRS